MTIYTIVVICIVLSTVSYEVYADYDCLCNYRVETPMYGITDTTTSPVGYLYEFDCKPVISSNSQDAWISIMNEHLIAYVENGDGLANQVCQGSIPSEDKLFSTSTTSTTAVPTTTKRTTAKPTTTQATTTKPTTTQPTTTKPTTTQATTTKPTTTQPTTTKPTTTQPTTTKPTTTQPTTTKPTTTQPTTTKPTTTQATTTKPTTTQPTTTKPTTTQTTTTTTIKTTTTMTATPAKYGKTTPPATAWSTTSDWLIHWNITHAPYTTKKPHHTTDWFNPWETTHPHFTKYQHTTNTVNTNHGNLQKCPGVLTRSVNAKWLRQYKSHCYELVRKWKDWYDAEDDCFQRLGHGGELLEIYTQDVQHYIMDFLHEVQFHNGIWIGLQDIDREEHFRWDSGRSLTYTNWNPNRKNNQLWHGKEDCVFMQSNGQWEDSLCSKIDINKRFLVDASSVNTRHPYICQYLP